MSFCVFINLIKIVSRDVPRIQAPKYKQTDMSSARAPASAPAPASARGSKRSRREKGLSPMHRLSELFAFDDLALLVLEFLQSRELLMCSMVSVRLRRVVDGSCSSVFAPDLTWWLNTQPGPESVHFSKSRCRFVLEHSLLERSLGFDWPDKGWTPRQKMWLLSNSARIGNTVCMRSNITFYALSPHLKLHGEEKHVQKIMQRKRISVDVLAWTITRMCTDPKDSRLQILTMAAKDYRHNDPKVDLRVSAPIVLTLLHVPKTGHLTLPQLSLRVLWVMRGIRHCMFCKQRPRSVQSFDTPHAAHRVLCSHCLELLFVAAKQLTRKWKVSLPKTLSVDQVPRVHYQQCFSGAPTHCWPAKNEDYLLKQDVAKFFKQPTWEAFIENNHSRSKSRRWGGRSQEKFYFCNRWF